MPIGFASEAWPRPGLAEPRSASLAGFGFFHQHIRKGKVVITKTSKEKRLLLGSFLAPETDMIFGDGVGASPVSAFLNRCKEQMPISMSRSATPGRLSIDEYDIIAEVCKGVGCHTQSRSSRQCKRITLRSPVVSLCISGGVAIAATFVVPGKQSNSS